MHPVGMFELVIGMLVGIVALHWLADRMRWPPSIALLIGGGALAFIPGAPTFHLDPDLVLVLFLPPLLMDRAGSPTSHAFGGTWQERIIRSPWGMPPVSSQISAAGRRACRC